MKIDRGPWPHDLSWDEVDPLRHPFDPGTASEVVRGLVTVGRIPTPPSVSAGPGEPDVRRSEDGGVWTDAMTAALVERFGRWATGWRWALDEDEPGGGPVEPGDPERY
ncbi:hypothetical protein PWG71_12220 [Nocardiopsis sp. N85]|uniref:hypothetical protein n=1 Tax=Nocardiopsis sp. N85 TaxID=3029400 RepID=UPI00237F5F51|nr:hypothetical protein [Nocardiopsis sp. N85]MDE3722156.1 hypothetical protein [Nocardiopsis sp. N85]